MTKVVSVRFRNGSKSYYFDPKDLVISQGQYLVVETSQGLEYVECVEAPHEVNDAAVVPPLRTVVRVATENDRHTAEYNRGRESEAFSVCEQRILSRKLDMKLVRAECSFDGSKTLFFFTADGRVDFRDLVKDLASVFRSRIELRQIGVRDEAKMLGGLGICGRPFCCNLYMDDFVPVSIKMAKTQGLSLNPTKISGTCGRLMCCLNYEQSAYEEAAKHMPKPDSYVLTPDGPGDVIEVNLLKECVGVILDGGDPGKRCYRNEEIVILRNGKGTKEGIDIPKERPSRFVPISAEEEISTLVARAHFENNSPVLDAIVESPKHEKKRPHQKGKKDSAHHQNGAQNKTPTEGHSSEGKAKSKHRPYRHRRKPRGNTTEKKED